MIYGRVWHDCGKHAGGQMSSNKGCGHHMGITEHAGVFLSRKGCDRRIICMHKQHKQKTRTKQQEKTKNKQIHRRYKRGQKQKKGKTTEK